MHRGGQRHAVYVADGAALADLRRNPAHMNKTCGPGRGGAGQAHLVSVHSSCGCVLRGPAALLQLRHLVQGGDQAHHELRWLHAQCSSHLEAFDHINAPLATLVFGHKALWLPDSGCELLLAQARDLARLLQEVTKGAVASVGRGQIHIASGLDKGRRRA